MLKACIFCIVTGVLCCKMIKLSLKLDISISKLALVFVSSAACYGVSHFVSGLVRPASQQNISDNYSKRILSDLGICKENNQESKAVNRNRTTFDVSGNPVTTSVSIWNEVNKT